MSFRFVLGMHQEPEKRKNRPKHQAVVFFRWRFCFRTHVLHIEPCGSRHRGISKPGCRIPITSESLLMLNTIIVGNPARINNAIKQKAVA